MSVINTILGVPLGFIMRMCYNLCANYGVAIILFTLVTKVLLLPLALWVHRSGIRLIKMQPELNRIKARFFGDPDAASEAQAQLYKQEKYNPLTSLIPLAVQILLLIGLIHVIYHPLTYILRLPAETIEALIARVCVLTGENPQAASIELSVLQAFGNPLFSAQLMADAAQAAPAIFGFNTMFLGVDTLWIPNVQKGLLVLVPLLAGASSLLLGFLQNMLNPVQAEQGKAGQYLTVALSVGISLYLGWFVPVGVALYWIVSNLYSILQQLALNHFINPRKHVDYEALEESKAELAALQDIGKAEPRSRALSAREKADYKRFFSIANKHLVFYSEKSGFFKYFEGVIGYLLENSNVIIHYVTSDPDDVIFQKASENERIKPYYIAEKKLITLMMKMDADMVVMTMPDLNSFHIKRSYVRKDIEYVYMFHSLLVGMRTLRNGALDHYDTILCENRGQVEEIRRIEADTGAPAKKLVPCGYSLLDILARDYEAMEKTDDGVRRALIAPSWQADNILESCLAPLTEALLADGMDVTVRSHPQYIKRFPAKYEKLMADFAHMPQNRFRFEKDFSSNETVYTADLLVTDWSGIGFEYALSTKKPVLFIDTPIKIVNEALSDEASMDSPLDIRLRNILGRAVRPEDISAQLPNILQSFADNPDAYRQEIERVQREEIFNFGSSAEHEGQYILQRLVELSKARKAANA